MENNVVGILPVSPTAQNARNGLFWATIRIGEPGDCWPWMGYRKPSGHGLTSHEGKCMHAHRKAWILACGHIPAKLCVNHACDNAACCNPSHMYLGTRAENMGDRFGTDGVTQVAKRRAAAGVGRGRRSGMSKAA